MNEFKIPDKQIIPLKIYQTWVSKGLPPHMKKCVDKLKNDNPEFEHFFYDDEIKIMVEDYYETDIKKYNYKYTCI
jgi:mannosyltransferase OCH1-like enzyme